MSGESSGEVQAAIQGKKEKKTQRTFSKLRLSWVGGTEGKS